MTSFTFSIPPPEEPFSRRFVRWLSRMFLLAGSVSLGYCAYFYGSAYAFQKMHTIAFDRALAAPAPDAFAINHTVTEGGIIGRIEIERLGVSAIVVEGDSASLLRQAVGHVPDTAMPGEQGNMALTAHRDTFFRPLRNIHEGDVITLETTGGQYQYEVKSTEIVSPAATEVLQSSGQQELTLITCYPFYFVGPAPQRFVVRADKIAE
jgi:sortase A